MANHCEKIVKKLIDKHFKQTSNTTNTKSASKYNFILEKNESKNDSNADEEEGQNEDDAEDCLQLQEKILLTEKVRKLNNEGLASVRFFNFSWLGLFRTNVLLLLKT